MCYLLAELPRALHPGPDALAVMDTIELEAAFGPPNHRDSSRRWMHLGPSALRRISPEVEPQGRRPLAVWQEDLIVDSLRLMLFHGLSVTVAQVRRDADGGLTGSVIERSEGVAWGRSSVDALREVRGRVRWRRVPCAPLHLEHWYEEQ